MRELMLSFADRHLSPYTLRGAELIPDSCPFCHGAATRERYTFSSASAAPVGREVGSRSWPGASGSRRRS